jgi:hypothetical protein
MTPIPKHTTRPMKEPTRNHSLFTLGNRNHRLVAQESRILPVILTDPASRTLRVSLSYPVSRIHQASRTLQRFASIRTIEEGNDQETVAVEANPSEVISKRVGESLRPRGMAVAIPDGLVFKWTRCSSFKTVSWTVHLTSSRERSVSPILLRFSMNRRSSLIRIMTRS